MPNDFNGELFLHRRDSSLANNEDISSIQNRLEKRGVKPHPDPLRKISRYLQWLEHFLQPTDLSGNIRVKSQERNLNVLEKELFSRVIISQDAIPQSYWDSQRQMARNMGHGDVVITDEMKDAHTSIIQKDQKTSLHKWTQYFSSPDSNSIPVWVKYWAFSSILKMGKFDIETKKFLPRSRSSVSPFPELNREALALAAGVLVDFIQKKQPVNSDEKLAELAKKGAFSSLYSYFYEQVASSPEVGLQNTAGSWKKFNKGSDARLLADSLQGRATGWCTADLGTAESQLSGGDFYVYYSQNEHKEDVIPRVAIRMRGSSQIEEVRGIDKDQNLDPYIAPIVEQKMSEFGEEGEKYKKRARHMRTLTEIERKHVRQEVLTSDEARLLWELDEKIEGFGYQEDPRVEEIRAERDIRNDLAICFNTVPEHISIDMLFVGRDSRDHIFSEGIVYHHGDLYINAESPSEWPQHVPKIVGGNVKVEYIDDISNLPLPSEVRGELLIHNVRSLENVTLPEKYNGIVNWEIEDLHDVEFYPQARGVFRFGKLKSLSNVKFPEQLLHLILDTLESTHNVKFPNKIDEYFSIGGLENFSDLVLPQSVGSLSLSSLKHLGNVILPQEIEKDIYLSKLENAKNLQIPKSFSGSLYLDSLKDASALVLPDRLDNLWLDSLESAEGLVLPYQMDGNLMMRGLKTARGIQFPYVIYGTIDLSKLETLDGLTFVRLLSPEDQKREDSGGFVPGQYYLQAIDLGLNIPLEELQEFRDRPENHHLAINHTKNTWGGGAYSPDPEDGA